MKKLSFCLIAFICVVSSVQSVSAECKSYVFYTTRNDDAGSSYYYVGKLKYCDERSGKKVGVKMFYTEKTGFALTFNDPLELEDISSYFRDRETHVEVETTDGSLKLIGMDDFGVSTITLSPNKGWKTVTITASMTQKVLNGVNPSLIYAGDFLIEGSKEGKKMIKKIESDFSNGKALFKDLVVEDSSMFPY